MGIFACGIEMYSGILGPLEKMVGTVRCPVCSAQTALSLARRTLFGSSDRQGLFLLSLFQVVSDRDFCLLLADGEREVIKEGQDGTDQIGTEESDNRWGSEKPVEYSSVVEHSTAEKPEQTFSLLVLLN